MMRLLLVHQQPKPAFYRQPKACTPPTTSHHRRKPNWLRLEVLRLKAHMPRAGCRAVAHTFNRLHPGVSVGKTFVADLIASHQHEIAELRRILKTCHTVAVVGLSAEWHRPSYFAAKYMQSHGYRIVPVNPRYANTKILGEPCYASLKDIPFPVDMVDVFRKTEDVLPIAQEALQIGAACLWQQLGVENQEASELFLKQGRQSVFNRCVKIEHARIFGGLNWVGVNTFDAAGDSVTLGFYTTIGWVVLGSNSVTIAP